MKNVVILYELIGREFLICQKLKRELERDSSIKAYVFSISFEWHEAVWLSRKSKIDFVLMPWMYTDVNYELVQPFIDNNPDVILGNFHHEEISSPAYESVLLPKTENAKNSMIHFVWTAIFAQILEREGVKTDNIFITGNARCDEGRSFSYDRCSLAQKYALDSSKKWILFAETRDDSPLLHAQKKRDLVGLGIDDEEIEQVAAVDKASLHAMIKEFTYIPDDFFDKYEFIYRPHPGHSANPEIDKRVRVISELSIYEWLHVADSYLTWQSTSIFESDLMGVPSFLYEPIYRDARFRVRGLDEYPTIKRIMDVMDIDMKKALCLQSERGVYKKYLGACDGATVENIAKVIKQLIERPPDGYKANYIGIGKYRLWRQYLFEVVTRFFLKLNLIELLRYPHTAYLRIRDIPYKKGNLP